MSAWPYDRDAWETSLWATSYAPRQAGLTLAGVASEDGFVALADIPKRAQKHLSALREHGFLETVRHGLRLTMAGSPVTIRHRTEAA